MARGVPPRSATRPILIQRRSVFAVSISRSSSGSQLSLTRYTDVSQHSHEIGLANLPYTRRGRREAAGRPRESTADPDDDSPSQELASTPSVPRAIAPASPPMRAQAPQHPASFASPYPHFPSMSMPVPVGFGATPQMSGGGERERIERERWDRMETLFQGIRNNARQFEYPPPSVAALESVLMRMYFESPLQHPQMGMPMQPMQMMQPPHPGAMVAQGQEHMNVNGGQGEMHNSSVSGEEGEGS